MKPSPLNRAVLLLLYIAFAAGICFTALLPWTVPIIMRTGTLPAGVGWRAGVTLACWYIGAGGALFILLTLIRMMRSLSSDPFVPQNISRLRRIGFVALVIAGISVLVTALNNFRTFFLLLSMALGFCGLLALVLGEVFKKAVEYRDEDRLVI